MARGDELQERLVDFAVRIVKLVSTLPKDRAGRHIADQLLRSGTSPAPNYAEARAGESKRDFAHKLKIASKELSETKVWLQILDRSGVSSGAPLQEAAEECDQLCRIVASSLRTLETRRS